MLVMGSNLVHKNTLEPIWAQARMHLGVSKSRPLSPKDPRWVSSGRGDGHDPSLVSRKCWPLRRWLASDWASLSKWGLSHPIFPLHWVFVFFLESALGGL